MAVSAYRGIKDALCRLYIDDPRPWLVGFSGDKDRISHKRAQGAQKSLRPLRAFAATTFGTRHSTLDTSPTCTVVERDKASEGLLAAGDERMEKLIEFRETLLEYQDPANGKRDMRRKNGAEGPGPLHIEARRELLTRLLKLQEQVGFKLISDDELFLIQDLWKSARRSDDGGGVARIVSQLKGIHAQS
jgi:hypothetical protein